MPDLENIANDAFDREEAKDENKETPKSETPKVDEPKVEEKPKEDEEKPKDDDEDGGYSADELDDDKEEQPKDEVKPVDADALPPQEKYIYENLPTISVKGEDGKTYNVKLAQELPDDFTFASAKEQALFNQNLASQESEARSLQSKWNQQDNDKRTGEFVKQEQLDIQADMASLQKDGLIAKFKLKPTDDGFADDPAVKETQAILDFYQKRNQSYADSNKAYRISFRDAAEIYLSQKKPATPPAPSKGDQERKQTAAKVGVGLQGGSTNTNERPRFKRGTSPMDIVDFYDGRMD
jgi:hypothetical protein